MECPRCATALDGKPNYCRRCGFVFTVVRYDSDARTAGRVPHCPRCRNPVRAGEYPHREAGYVSPEPWNAGWDGTCERCGFEFCATHSLDSRDWHDLPIGVQLPASTGVRRSIVVRPASVGSFQDRDVQLHLAGIEIGVETESYGQSNSSQQYFLSKEEAAWLVRALQGSLAISFEQYHWDLDVT